MFGLHCKKRTVFLLSFVDDGTRDREKESRKLSSTIDQANNTGEGMLPNKTYEERLFQNALLIEQVKCIILYLSKPWKEFNEQLKLQ